MVKFAHIPWRSIRRKKLGLASAGILTLLGAPLAVQALQTPHTPSQSSSLNITSSNPQKDKLPEANVPKQSSPDTDTNSLSVTSSQQAGQDPEVEVRVNGQVVPVPNQKSFHKSYQGSTNQSHVDITVQSEGGSSSSSVHSSTSIEINGQSYSTGSNVSGEVGGRHPSRR